MARIVADQLTGACVHGHRLGLATARLAQQAVARLVLGIEALARGTAVTVVLVAVIIAIIVAVVVVLTITLVVTLLAAQVHLIFNLVKEAHGCVLSRFSAGAPIISAHFRALFYCKLRAKYYPAQANERRAFLKGRLKVLAHAAGKLGQAQIGVRRLKLIP